MQRIEAADLEDIVQVGEPRVAPGGDHVAFVRTVPEGGESYESTVYLVPTGGGEPRRFTLAAGVDSAPRFSPSGDRLAIVSTRGEDDRPQLWVVPTDGGEGRQVTSVVGGVTDLTWSPDGTQVAFCQRVSDEDRQADRDREVATGYESDRPDPRVIDRTVYRSMEQYFDGTRVQVYVIDLADDGIRRLTTRDRDHGNPTWGDEETLYYTVSTGDPDPDDSTAYDIVAHDLTTGETDRLHSANAARPALAATSDGRIAHLSTDPDQSTLRPTELHVLDTDGSVTDVTADLDRTLGYEANPQWDPEESQLYFTTPDEGAATLWTVDWQDADPERVLREDWATVGDFHVGSDIVAFVKSEWDHPGDVFVSTPGGSEQHRLTRVNADYLDARAVSRPEEIRYETRVDPDTDEDARVADSDDAETVELQGWVLTPPDFDPDAEYPLAVEVHGGPHAMWTTSDTMWHEFQTLAARGYVVFWSNPRGSAGYGESFMAAIERDWGEITMHDVMAGVETVTEREYVDADQLFLTGGSFGGYATGWFVGHTDAFEAAVAQRGVYDLTSFYGSTDTAYSLVEGDFDTTPWEEPAVLWNHSPTGHAHEVATPTLVLHSDDDYRTPACSAELFYRILRKHGVDTRFVRYPDEGHELSRSGEPRHRIDRIERIVRWFDGYSASHDPAPALERDPEAGLSGTDETSE